MTDSESTRAAVERFYDAALRADLDAIAEVLHADVVNYEAESLPYGGVHRGKDAVLRLLKLLFDGIDLDTVKRSGLMVDGERAASFLEVPFAFADPTVPQKMPVLETFVVRDGLIVEIRPYYFDTAAIAARG
jgi:ketosteroid isomerase-like protein